MARTRRAECEIWGVLNVTPDSFSDGGRYLERDTAVARAEAMLAEGAHVIDIGGESTRPSGATYGAGAARVTADEEKARVIPVIEALNEAAQKGDAPVETVVSIDTTKAAVADAALRAGARIVNDVGGGEDPELLAVVAKWNAELVLMHNRGRGSVTPENTEYVDVVKEVRDELLRKAEQAQSAGVERDRIWIDPGIGFAKTAEQSTTLLANTSCFVDTGFAVLIGASRKSFLAKLAPNQDGELPTADERLGGSIAAATLAAHAGAAGVRVHDVFPTRQAVNLAIKSRPERGDRWGRSNYWGRSTYWGRSG